MTDIKLLLTGVLATMSPEPPPRQDHSLDGVVRAKQKLLVATARRVRRENRIAALMRKVTR
jgi:hypothetical protein